LQAIERFRYHAATLGVSGRIRQPFEHAICPQADVTLPESGGYVHSRVDKFNFRDLITFDSAIAFAAGSFSVKDDAFDATASVTIEGLNILNMITADRVTARIASSHPRSGAEPRITPIGSSFENLRIAGYKVEVDLAVDTFAEFDTASELRSACESRDMGDRLQPHTLSTERVTEEMAFTLVRSVRGLGREIQVAGNTIRIRDFGVVRLAEISVSERKRRISMVQFNLGSTPEADGQAGGAEGNGSAN
jgi:hypothetical protein